MKVRPQVLRVLPVLVLACSLLPAPALAQFTQQGPKLVGTSFEQGFSVALSGDGNTAILGGLGNATLVYTRSGGVWTQQANLVGTGGQSVSLSGDGNTAILGEPEDIGVSAPWVLTRSGGVWSQQAQLLGTGAVGPDAAEQGFSVALSGDGNTAIVGGIGDNNFVGAAWVHIRSGGVWSQQGPKLVGTGSASPAAQGLSVALSGDGNTAIVGGVGGAAWVYTRSGGMWSQQAKLVATGALSVSLSDDGNTASWVGSKIVPSAPRGCTRARARCGASKARNWSAQAS